MKTSDEELLMSPGMDATIFLVQIGIDYIAYFPFSTLQLFELLNTKFLLKMNQKEEGEGSLDSTGEGEGEAGEDEEEEEQEEEEEE